MVVVEIGSQNSDESGECRVCNLAWFLACVALLLAGQVHNRSCLLFSAFLCFLQIWPGVMPMLHGLWLAFVFLTALLFVALLLFASNESLLSFLFPSLLAV